MTTLQADTKAPAPKPRESRATREDARKADDRPAPRTTPLEANELETYNLPFTD